MEIKIAVVSVAGALLSALGFFYFSSAKSEKILIKKQVLSKESYKEFTFEIRKAFSAMYWPELKLSREARRKLKAGRLNTKNA